MAPEGFPPNRFGAFHTFHSTKHSPVDLNTISCVFSPRSVCPLGSYSKALHAEILQAGIPCWKWLPCPPPGSTFRDVQGQPTHLSCVSLCLGRFFPPTGLTKSRWCNKAQLSVWLFLTMDCATTWALSVRICHCKPNTGWKVPGIFSLKSQSPAYKLRLYIKVIVSLLSFHTLTWVISSIDHLAASQKLFKLICQERPESWSRLWLFESDMATSSRFTLTSITSVLMEG